ncbi:MAG: SDR family NAD(P)-dependent oxidoreductase [Acidimicrobiales bacterium]
MARVVVVTGSVGGIGSALLERFAAGGDVAVGLDVAEGADVRVDLADPDACGSAIGRVLDEHGRIDVLCNNAGVSAVGDVVTATPADWQRVFAVNVFAMAYVSRAALPAMRASGRGAIVNTCSVAAVVGLVERAVYSASKGAVLALTKAMAADEVAHGIRVNCVCPGTVDGPWVRRLIATAPDPAGAGAALRARQPLGDLLPTEAVVDAIAYLAADTTFTTGSEWVLDGGITGVRIVR